MRGHRLTGCVVALCVVVAACAGGDDDSQVVLTAAERVEAAAATTAERGTARVEMRVEIDGSDPALTGVAFTGQGEMALDGSAASLDVALPGAGLSFEMLMFGTVAYYAYPPEIMRELGSDAAWVRLDTAELLGAAGFDENTFRQLQHQDPSQMLRYLTAVGGTTTEVGPEDVRGVETTHYRASLDTTRRDFDDEELADLEIDADGLREYLALLADTYGVTEVPTNVWLDADGAVRRFEMKLDMGLPLAAQGIDASATMLMSMEFFDFGVAIDVEEPSPEAVVDFADLPGLAVTAPV